MIHSTWNADWFPLPGAAVFDRDKQRVAAVSRAPGNLDLFVIGFDNRVWTTFWNAGGWNADWFPLPGQAVFDRDRQEVVAVSRAPGNLDLFVIGFDNRVWSTFWAEGRGWNADWFLLPGAAVFDRDKQRVAAVSRAPGNLDLFVIGFDNRVWSTHWAEGRGWNADWFLLPGAAVFDRDKQRVAAVSRAPGNLDLFVIGFDNRVWTTFWNAGGWNADWFLLPGAAVFDRDKQQISVVSRGPGNLDLFVIGFDNRVWSTHWAEGRGWNADWFLLPGAAVFDRDKQQISVVSRGPGNLDLFVIGFDNRVWSTHWAEGRGWNADWFPLPGAATFDRDKQRVTAVSRADANLDLFAIGFDNRIWSTFWGTFQREYSALIATGGLAALGGWVKVTVYADGGVRWQGHAHNSGLDGYDFGVSAVVRTPAGRGVALARSGHVGGTIAPGSRDYDWDVTEFNPMVAASFDDFANGHLETNLEYSSDIGSAFEQALGWLIRYGVGSALGPAGGAVIFVGVEVGSLISTGSLVPGARVVGGLLWMAGPANTLFAIAAEGIAALGSRTREVYEDEYDWANAEVFAGSLPPRDRLVLTDTIGGGDRAFTFPRFDGKITLNMGPAAFDDPRRYKADPLPDGRRYQRKPEKYPVPNPPIAYGEIFIHELVHACQIYNAKMDLGLIADALASKVCEATGGDPYLYGAAGSEYTSLNLEQQAQIVSDWFAGAVQKDSNQTGMPKDLASPYFGFITGNVRIGRF